MRDINRDLQAGHQILSLFERSKDTIDSILDRQPALFAIVDSSGRILRGNDQLAQQFGRPLDQCSGLSLNLLFTPEAWNTFFLNLLKVTDSRLPMVAFELPIQSVATKQIVSSIYWRVEILQLENSPGLRMALVLGQDISELRRSERQLSELFATTPIGLMTIDQKGNISSSYSAYCEWLLDTSNIAGKNACELIFCRGQNDFSMDQLSAVDQIPNLFGKSAAEFEQAKIHLPVELNISLGHPAKGLRWLSITYHAIEVAGRIQKILLTLSDKTSAVELRQLHESRTILQETAVVRILEVKRCKLELLELLVQDFAGVFSGLSKATVSQDWDKVKRALHSIKGNARIVNFDQLSGIVHNLETFVSSKSEAKDPSWQKEIEERMDQLLDEWQEYLDLIFAFHKINGDADAKKEDGGSDLELILKSFQALINNPAPEIAVSRARIEMALKILNSTPVSELEAKVNAQVQRVSAEQVKQVEVSCNWNEVRVNEEILSVLSDSLVQLVNNALVHGVELPEERKLKNKPAKGKITVECRETASQLICEFSDDGRGIDIDRVRGEAVQRRLISFNESLNLSEQQLMQLIFQRGLSTAKSIDQTAGRGIGLDIIAENVKKVSGSVVVEAHAPYGTRIKFTIPIERKNPEKKLIFLSSFLDQLNLEIQQLNHSVKLDLPKISLPNLNDQDFIFFGNAANLVLALSSIVADAAIENEVRIELAVQGERLVFSIHSGKSRPRIKLPPEFAIGLSGCYATCYSHLGEILRRNHQLTVSLGWIVNPSHLPPLVLAPEPNQDFELVNKTLNRVKKICKRFAVQARELEKTLPLSYMVSIVKDASKSTMPVFTFGASEELQQKEFLSLLDSLLMGQKRVN